MKFSNLFTLNIQQFVTGLLYAIAGGVWALIAPAIILFMQNPYHADFNIIFNWPVIWHTAVATGSIYLGAKLVSGQPKAVHIDPEVTSVVDSETKKTLINAPQQ